jgi:hypothetical protein
MRQSTSYSLGTRFRLIAQSSKRCPQLNSGPDRSSWFAGKLAQTQWRYNETFRKNW